MEFQEHIDKLPLLSKAFRTLSAGELKRVADVTSTKTYPPNHILCHEGAIEHIFYIIVDGKIEISKAIADTGKSRVLRIGEEGDLVGEMALIQNEPRSATVRTTTTCTVLEMEKRDFESLLNQLPRMAIDIMGVTLNRFRENDQMAIKDLQKTNEILRQLDRNKLEFIQVAAHELRTPLTVIKGYVDVLKTVPEVGESALVESVLAGIKNGTDRMLSVVNLMLDITRFDDENLEMRPAPVSIKKIAESILIQLKQDVDNRDIQLDLACEEGLPDVFGDPDMLQKAIFHLIVNAIKYTPDGGKVSINIRSIHISQEQPGIEISIKDTGIGLAQEHHELVFEKFYQVGSVAIHSSGKTTFKGGGPGLGLAIVASVARNHNGKVWVESTGYDEELYPGCTFYLQIPIDSSISAAK